MKFTQKELKILKLLFENFMSEFRDLIFDIGVESNSFNFNDSEFEKITTLKKIAKKLGVEV